MNRWGNLVSACALLASVVVAGYISEALEPVLAYPDGVAAGASGEARRFTGLSLFGQLRVTLGKYFWLRTDDYLHFGIMSNAYTHQKAQREMIDGVTARMQGRGGLIKRSARPKARDWRGIFKYFDFIQPVPGYHGNPVELLPWYRAQTVINPLDTDAYVNAAFFLADFEQKPDEALAFLKEGAENNPDSAEIHAAIGRLYFEKWAKYDEAIPHLEKAVAAGRGIENRDEADRQTIGNAYVFLVQCHRKMGGLDAALRTAEDGVAEVPDYALVRTIHRIVKRDIEEKSKR